jgi:hypothetical protein
MTKRSDGRADPSHVRSAEKLDHEAILGGPHAKLQGRPMLSETGQEFQPADILSVWD